MIYYYEIIIDETRKNITNKNYDISMIEIKENIKKVKILFFDINNHIFETNSKEIFKNRKIYLLHYDNNLMNISIGLIKNFY